MYYTCMFIYMYTYVYTYITYIIGVVVLWWRARNRYKDSWVEANEIKVLERNEVTNLWLQQTCGERGKGSLGTKLLFTEPYISIHINMYVYNVYISYVCVYESRTLFLLKEERWKERDRVQGGLRFHTFLGLCKYCLLKELNSQYKQLCVGRGGCGYCEATFLMRACEQWIVFGCFRRCACVRIYV